MWKDPIYIAEKYSILSEIIEECENKMFTIKNGFQKMKEFGEIDDIAGVFDTLRERFVKNEIIQINGPKNADISPEIYNFLSKCPATSISIERSFSMEGSLITKEKGFKDENIVKYMMLYYTQRIFIKVFIWKFLP